MNIRIIIPNPYGPLAQDRLAEFERITRLNLPDDYRDFLFQNNGGQPTPAFFWIEPQKDGSDVHQFYGLHNGPAHLCIDTYIGEERYGIPSTMLPIGDDGLGDFICLGVSSANFGGVYFLDHERHPYDNPNSDE
jgi:hypothetical protein